MASPARAFESAHRIVEVRGDEGALVGREALVAHAIFVLAGDLSVDEPSPVACARIVAVVDEEMAALNGRDCALSPESKGLLCDPVRRQLAQHQQSRSR